MFRQFKTWIRILIKITLAGKAFYALLVLIPLLCMGMGQLMEFQDRRAEDIIYLYARSSDSFSENILDELLGEFNGYSFVLADSEDTILREVRNHTALCGYILEEDIPDRISRGKLRDNVILVAREGNLNTDIVSEMVFSSYYKEFTKYYTLDSISGLSPDDFDSHYYETVGSNILPYTIDRLEVDEGSNSSTRHAARNITGIFLCLFAMMNMVSFISDSESGILRPVPPAKRILFRLTYFTVPLLMMLPSSLLGAMLQNNNSGIVSELLSLIIYDLLLVILCTGFSYILKKRHIILGMIPVLTIFFIIVCPIFIDLSPYLPIIGILRYICPPYFYMV